MAQQSPTPTRRSSPPACRKLLPTSAACAPLRRPVPNGLPVGDMVRFVMYADGYGQFPLRPGALPTHVAPAAGRALRPVPQLRRPVPSRSDGGGTDDPGAGTVRVIRSALRSGRLVPEGGRLCSRLRDVTIYAEQRNSKRRTRSQNWTTRRVFGPRPVAEMPDQVFWQVCEPRFAC